MKKWSLILSILIFLIVSVFWIVAKNEESYSEPQEALFAVDKDLVLIPGYKLNNTALFFFIKQTENLGAAYVQEGLFGWQTGMFTWSPMDNERSYEDLKGHRIHGENLIYGLIRHGDERLIQVDENPATLLNLAMLPQDEVEKYNLEGLYIWYYESETPLESNEITLLNRDTREVLDTIHLN